LIWGKRIKIVAIEVQFGEKLESLTDAVAENPDWDADAILSKTGIVFRYVSSVSQTALGLSIVAARKLLARFDAGSIDGLIYVTQSPDTCIPTNACVLAEALSLPKRLFAYDINQGCSGFTYGLVTINGLIRSGAGKRFLLICSDTYTKYINKHDRSCRPIFSDAATATLVEDDGRNNLGVPIFMTDGSGAQNLKVDDGRLFMDGAKVLMFTMAEVPRATRALLHMNEACIDEVDHFVFHQASRVVLMNLQRLLNIPNKKLLINFENVGNTVSSSIPVAIQGQINNDLFGQEKLIAMVGFGVGYSLAGCLYRT
jgi:3-oxoacyl-[acyl-carrier-protein] synthase III